MAQLPSGRHVAIQATPLFALIEAACEPEAVITRLLRIEQVADLAPYIEVMFFREVADAPIQEIASGSHPIPPEIEAFSSGFTMATLDDCVSSWSAVDQQAFADYVASERVLALLSALLDKVNEVKHWLAREGDNVQRLQALMWETDCHPLQSSEFPDPIDALLRVENEAERGDVP